MSYGANRGAGTQSRVNVYDEENRHKLEARKQNFEKGQKWFKEFVVNPQLKNIEQRREERDELFRTRERFNLSNNIVETEKKQPPARVKSSLTAEEIKKRKKAVEESKKRYEIYRKLQRNLVKEFKDRSEKVLEERRKCTTSEREKANLFWKGKDKNALRRKTKTQLSIAKRGDFKLPQNMDKAIDDFNINELNQEKMLRSKSLTSLLNQINGAVDDVNRQLTKTQSLPFFKING